MCPLQVCQRLRSTYTRFIPVNPLLLSGVKGQLAIGYRSLPFGVGQMTEYCPGMLEVQFPISLDQKHMFVSVSFQSYESHNLNYCHRDVIVNYQ